MARKYLPTINSKLESECLLNDIRVDKGFYLDELMKIVGINATTFNDLVRGKISPFYETDKKKGEIRPYVKKLLKVLEVDFATAFPRYACIFDRNVNAEDMFNGYTYYQVLIQSFGSFNLNFEKSLEREQLWRQLFKLSNKYPLTFSILLDNGKISLHMEIYIKRNAFSYSFDELSEEYGVSRQRIKQILDKQQNEFAKLIKFNPIYKELYELLIYEN